MKAQCYWCGDKATGKEHVPPLNLFPKAQRSNLITVPACEFHNNSFSKLDERWRFMLQTGSHTNFAFDAFDEKTVRSLQYPEAKSFVRSLFVGARREHLPAGESRQLSYDYAAGQKYFEKIARGLYWHHMKSAFEGSCLSVIKQTFATTPGVLEFFKKVAPGFLNSPACKEGQNSNPDIFQYRYVQVSHSGNNALAIAMQFYRSVEVISILTAKR